MKKRKGTGGRLLPSSEDIVGIYPLLDGLSDGLCLTAENGLILYLNRAAEHMLGVSFEEVSGVPLCDILCGKLATSDCMECKSSCALRDPTSGAKAVTFRGRYGPQVAYEWKDFGFRRLEKTGHLRVRCLSLGSDISGWAQSPRHFTIMEDISAEYELEERKEDWRSMVAHDLRSPLTVILGSLMQLRELESSGDAADRGKLIDLAVGSGRGMLELLGLYLDLAKLDSGLMPVKLADVDIGRLIAATVKEQQVLAAAKRVVLSVEAVPGLKASADEGLLVRVVQNLLNNAVKFTPPDGRVRLRAGEEGEEAVFIAINDDGPGIALEDLPRIFDRYYQSAARRQGRIKGTGLGLAFCRQALSAMGGEVSVRSVVGKGSEFRILLPSGRRTHGLRPQEA